MESTTTVHSYPRIPSLTDKEIVSLLEAVPITRLATHNPDGSIHVVPLLSRYVDGVALLGTEAVSRTS